MQLTVNYLRLRLTPFGEHQQKRFAEMFFRVNALDYTNYRSFFEDVELESGKTKRYFNHSSFCETFFDSEDRFYMSYENLYDLIESFYLLMEWNELDDPYLHHLADIAYEFGLRRGPDLRAFLEDYDVRKKKIAVQIPESDDAVTVMTIHKSKGLEFPVVLIPSLNFKLSLKSKFLKESDDMLLYDQPKKNDPIPVMKALYASEEGQIFTDRTNLCYVALTRAAERLYVQNKFEKNSFGAHLHQVLDGISPENDGVVTIERGERATKNELSTDSNGEFVPEDIQDRLWYPHIALQDTEELYDEEYLSDEMQFGIHFHRLASELDSSASVAPALQRDFDEGIINKSHIESLNNSLKALFENDDYHNLLLGADRVLNERDLIDDSKVYRPDKMIFNGNRATVVDFKTGLPSQKDLKQMKEYASILNRMGFEKVYGYNYYSSLKELRLTHSVVN